MTPFPDHPSQSYRILRSICNPVTVTALHCSPTEEQFAVVCDDGTVRIIDASGREWFNAHGHRQTVRDQHIDDLRRATCVAWSPDGSRLAIGYADGSLGIWSPQVQLETLSWEEAHRAMLCELAWNPVEMTLASIGDDGTLALWDVGRGELLASYGRVASDAPVELRASPDAMAWSPDGSQFVVACNDMRLHLLDAPGGPRRAEHQCQCTINALAWEPEGTRVLLLFEEERLLALWDTVDGAVRMILPSSAFEHGAFSPDGRFLALATAENVGVWRTHDFFERGSAPLASYRVEEVRSLAWSRAGTLMFGGDEGIAALPFVAE